MDVNVVMVSGNLTHDVKLEHLIAGTTIAQFTLAVNHKQRTASGFKEETCFVRAVAFGNIAELCSQYLRKGAGCFIKGRLRQEKPEGPEDRQKSRTRVYIEDIKFFDKKKDKNAQGTQTQA